MAKKKQLSPMEDLKTLQNLKTLNQMLAKETMEKRFQIENLKSDLEDLSEETSVLSDIERAVFRVVVSDTMGKAAPLAENEQLRSKVAELEKVKEVSEGVNASQEAEIFRLKKKMLVLEELETKNGEQEARIEELEKGKEEKEMVFETKVRELESKLRGSKEKMDATERFKAGQEVENLRLKEEMVKLSSSLLSLQEVEKKNGELEIEIGGLVAKVEELEKGKKEKEMVFETKVREFQLELGHSKEKLDATEQLKMNQDVEILRLKEEMGKLSSSLVSLREVEKKNGELEVVIGGLLAKVEELEKEKKGRDMVFEAKIREFELKMDANERLKVDQEVEILRLKEEMAKLSSNLLSLQEVEKKNGELKVEIGGHLVKIDELEKAKIRELEMTEQAKAEKEVEVRRLKEEVAKLSLSVLSLNELEKKYAELEQVSVTYRVNVDRLEKEKEEKKMEFEAKLRESALAVEKLKASQDVEILQLKQECANLSTSLSNLQEVEKRNGELEQEIARHMANVDLLEKEKQEKEMWFEKKIADSMLELEDLKKMMLETEQAKASHEAEILELKNEITKLISNLSQLKESSAQYLEKNAQLQSSQDAVQKELDIQREEAGCLKLQVDKLTQSRDKTLQELKDVQSSFNALALEKEKEKNFLEKRLSAAETKYEKSLSLLKDTVGALNSSEEKLCDNGTSEVDEKILPFIGELENIKTAHNDKKRMVEEMKRELDVSKKNKGLWMWLYPATTTIIAALSFAYAAKVR